MKKNNLDEMQEQALLKIEHNGYWLGFFGLLVALLVQVALGSDIKTIAGEFIVFMVLCGYLLIACLRKGIWDRQLKANGKTNLLCSLFAGVIMFLFATVRAYLNYPDAVWGSIAAGAFMGIIVFFLCWAALSICSAIYKKRREKLESGEKE